MAFQGNAPSNFLQLFPLPQRQAEDNKGAFREKGFQGGNPEPEIGTESPSSHKSPNRTPPLAPPPFPHLSRASSPPCPLPSLPRPPAPRKVTLLAPAPPNRRENGQNSAKIQQKVAVASTPALRRYPTWPPIKHAGRSAPDDADWLVGSLWRR